MTHIRFAKMNGYRKVLFFAVHKKAKGTGVVNHHMCLKLPYAPRSALTVKVNIVQR